MGDDQKLLTVGQVAHRLQISPSLLYREIKNGEIKVHRFGKRCYRSLKKTWPSTWKSAWSGRPQLKARPRYYQILGLDFDICELTNGSLSKTNQMLLSQVRVAFGRES
jgi:excisionase family DNA binding protein